MSESVFLAQIDSARHDVEHIWSFLGRALYSAAKLVTVGENILIWSDDARAWVRVRVRLSRPSSSQAGLTPSNNLKCLFGLNWESKIRGQQSLGLEL